VRAMLSPRNGNAAPLNGGSATLVPSTTIQGTPQQ
jgi:lipopolysaccharide export system protein LptA